MLYMYCLLQNLAARRPWKSEDGVTAIEYGLIAALIAVAIIAAVTTLGGQLKDTFNTISGNMKNAG
jgi:pilus assembly protein Flp/PilA